MFIGRLDKIKATIYVILYPGGGGTPLYKVYRYVRAYGYRGNVHESL